MDGFNHSVFTDISTMQKKFGMPEDGSLMTPEFLDFRFKFQLEELIEMDSAIEKRDAPGVVDALIDTIVVAVGTLNLMGVNGQVAWDEVLRANMSKECRENPTRSGSGGKDLVKPQGWQPPDLVSVCYLEGLTPAFNGPRVMPHSISVLLEAASLQLKKDSDYNDNIPRGAYWIHGIDSLEYELNKKNNRFRSVLNKMRKGTPIFFESLVDSLFDKIVYAALAVSWIRKREPGQDISKDVFNK